MSLSAQLAEFARSTRFADLPEAAVHAAERSLLDAVGVSLAATTLGEGCEAFADLVIGEGGRADATVLGFGVRVPAAQAALANGAFAHALDFEDAYDAAPSHPNAQTIPAVLALAERGGLAGTELLTGIAVGCDITCRVAHSVGSSLARAGWYPPPIVGGIGATFACANLLGLDARQTLDAVSIALGQITASGEVMNSPHSVMRGVRDAFPAQAAVRAVDLARRGVRGYDRPLEGNRGFFAAYARGEFDPAALTTNLGVEFAGERVSFKPWPSCRGTHSFIEGCLALRSQVALDDVVAVELTGAPLNLMLAEPVAAKAAPTNAIDAKFSLPFTVATALVDGAVTLRSFDRDALRRRPVLDLARRVTFTADPALDAPSRMATGRTLLRLADSSVREHTVLTPLGSPDAQLADHWLVEKFVACAALAARPLDTERARACARQLLHMRDCQSVVAVMSSLA
jgi:2-methylcitrate dehydratase PrpD